MSLSFDSRSGNTAPCPYAVLVAFFFFPFPLISAISSTSSSPEIFRKNSSAILVLSQTIIMTGGVLSCASDACSMYSKRSFHWLARVFSASWASRYTASGLGFFALPGNRSAGRIWSFTARQRRKYFGSGRPVVSLTGSRGILVMPLSMASTSPKSLTSHGKGVPSGWPLP